MLKAFARNIEPLAILTGGQVETIHRATLDVLQGAGIRLEHERALKLFADHGCQVDFDEQRVRVPDYLVEECLRQAPSSFAVKARDPKYTVRMGGNALYFENSVGMRIVDLDTWEARPATMREQHEGVRVLDALDTVHRLTTYTPYMEIAGVSPCMTLLESLASRIKNSSKSQSASYSNGSEIFAIEMAKVVGIDLLGTIMPSPPLTYSKDAVEAIFRFVAGGFPISIGGGAVMGATGPATIAGSTVTTNAELMAAIVLAQLISPGIGVQVNDSVYPMDMRTAQPAFGAPGAALHNVMFNQIWRSYKIPTCSWIAGVTSSKKIDFQCGCEKALVTLACALSGANLISLHGAVHGELTFHPVQAILDDDIAGMVGRFIKGVEVSDETLAIDLIEQVGPIPGCYLNTAHTRKWWKSEQFMPKVMDRELYPQWIKGGKKDALALAKERLQEILVTYEPIPLPEDRDREIDKILEAARKHYERKGLM